MFDASVGFKLNEIISPQSSTIMYARWPTPGDVDVMLIKASNFLMDTAHDLRLRLKNRIAQAASKVQHTAVFIID